MRNKTSTNEYLAFLSAKYQVDPDNFFEALLLASKTSKSTCGALEIERRRETRDKAVFLISTNSKVVAQLPITKKFMLDKGHPIGDFMKTDHIRRYLAKRAREKSVVSIGDLQTGMKQIRLKARVLEISKPNVVFTRHGNCASMANALIADDTGTIKLCLWNDQISSISVGDTIQIENGRTSTFRGQRQLNVGKNGLLNIVAQPAS